MTIQNDPIDISRILTCVPLATFPVTIFIKSLGFVSLRETAGLSRMLTMSVDINPEVRKADCDGVRSKTGGRNRKARARSRPLDPRSQPRNPGGIKRIR